MKWIICRSVVKMKCTSFKLFCPKPLGPTHPLKGKCTEWSHKYIDEIQVHQNKLSQMEQITSSPRGNISHRMISNMTSHYWSLSKTCKTPLPEFEDLFIYVYKTKIKNSVTVKKLENAKKVPFLKSVLNYFSVLSESWKAFYCNHVQWVEVRRTKLPQEKSKQQQELDAIPT